MVRIFGGPKWHLIAYRAEVPEPGDFKTVRVGEASVLLVHGDDGDLRVFQNSYSTAATSLPPVPAATARKSNVLITAGCSAIGASC